jgi:GT2 family glycosyltransferase
MKLLVVVVNYNGLGLTVDCLESLVPEIRSLHACQVGLCDNGSESAEVDKLERQLIDRAWTDFVTLTRIYPNRGFTGGNNAVIRPVLESEDPPDYVLLLNNDTIVRPGALRALVDFMDAHREVGIAGSRLENPDGTAQYSAFRFINAFSEFDRGLNLSLVSRVLYRYLARQPISPEPKAMDWVSGASMIVRRQVFQSIGLLDEGYYTYFDDIDICRTARSHGWSTWYVPSSRIVHLVGQTTGVTGAGARQKRTPDYYLVARRRYLTKHLHPLHAMACDAAFLAGGSLRRLRYAMTWRLKDLPPHDLMDHARHSVLFHGFRPPIVPNPSLTGT